MVQTLRLRKERKAVRQGYQRRGRLMNGGTRLRHGLMNVGLIVVASPFGEELAEVLLVPIRVDLDVRRAQSWSIVRVENLDDLLEVERQGHLLQDRVFFFRCSARGGLVLIDECQLEHHVLLSVLHGLITDERTLSFDDG